MYFVVTKYILTSRTFSMITACLSVRLSVIVIVNMLYPPQELDEKLVFVYANKFFDLTWLDLLLMKSFRQSFNYKFFICFRYSLLLIHPSTIFSRSKDLFNWWQRKKGDNWRILWQHIYYHLMNIDTNPIFCCY